MFDDLIKEIKKLEKGITLSIPIEADKDGYLDKECPGKECQVQFKVHENDWKSDQHIFCPICKHMAFADQWYTTEQAKRFKEIGVAHLKSRINSSMASSARKFNQRQPRNSFLSITLSHKGKPVSIPMPPAATDPLQLKITCPECQCRYAVIGAGFFCPLCGHNSAEDTFIQSIKKAKATLEVIEKLEEIEIQVGRDHTENAKQMMLEKCIEAGVMAFQRAAEVIYKTQAGEESLTRNVFQRLDQGSDLWKDKFGIAYLDIISEKELKTIRIAFQQRHLLSHCEGIVDQEYIDKSGDLRYTAGQRISLKKNTILDFLNALEKLFEGLQKSIRNR